MSIKRLKDLPDGSGSLSNDDIFIFMDNPSGSGITKKISFNELNNALGAISNLVEDSTPQLGGNLDLNNSNITGSGNININGGGNFSSLQINGTGISISGHTHTSLNITDFNSSVSGLLPSGLVTSNTSSIVGASGVNNLVQISQANYDALVTKDPNTVYFIV